VTTAARNDPTGWKAVDRLIGIVENAPPDLSENPDVYHVVAEAPAHRPAQEHAPSAASTQRRFALEM
jgi:hypothetical protein